MTTTDTDCHCDACNALNSYYGSDPALLAFYRKRLLVRGWAGKKTPIERAYILAHAPFAQAAAKAGAANLSQYGFSRVEPSPTDAPEAEMVAEGLEVAEADRCGAIQHQEVGRLECHN